MTNFTFTMAALLGFLFFSTFAMTASAVAAPAHDPHMWEKDIQKFEAADRRAKPAPGGVVFVGSSSIRMWNVHKAFPDTNVINRGFGGSWSCDSAYYAKRIVIPYRPRTIIFYAGDNDIAGGASPKEVLESFKQFVSEVRDKLPKTEIVFISIKPSIARWRLFGKMQKANSMVKDFAQGMKIIAFIDVSKQMLGPDGKPRKELFRKDGLHMNARGYAIWNKLVAPYISKK